MRRSRPFDISSGHIRMIDVGAKAVTRRRAAARGFIAMSARALRHVKEGTLPKGNVLRLAEVAGIQAAKRTSETLPLCHPLALDCVEVSFEVLERPPRIQATCEAATDSKTGVEMEALCGVSGALLAVYDLVKGVEPALSISDIRLLYKEGGKSGFWRHPAQSSTRRSAAPLAPCLRQGVGYPGAPALSRSSRTMEAPVARDVARRHPGRMEANGVFPQ
ncbi:MAG: cyclic pyranopterin monophosphate synthase MoaC, partial [Elusimicrobia bacterium]|nr:cyclic pyranopterin monophosphate synthase MoaC [Elusimicrobiota bacterium]